MSLKFHFSGLNWRIIKVIIALLIVASIIAAIAISYHPTTDQSTQKPSPEPTLSSTPSASLTSTPSSTPTLSPSPHATITLIITDTETNKFVDNASVLIDGQDVGTTMQNGELQIENIEFGKHRISIIPYYEQYTVEQNITVLGDITLPISINMPNAVFEVKVDVKLDYITFRELGRVRITLTNTGQVASQNTMALIFVYLEDNLDTPVTNRTIDFGNIEADAQPITKEIVGIDSFVWPTVERVAVVIVDRGKYIPENNQVISQRAGPPWFTAEIIDHTYAYISEHPEINGTVAKIILTR